MRRLLGWIATTALELIGRLPPTAAQALGTALLPLYVPFRFATRKKLRSLRPPVAAFAYYRMRLRLALLSVHGKQPDGKGIMVEGAGCFDAALSSGKPVLLLGWHQGPIELLHRIPAVRRAAHGIQPFFVMTASAFAPALAAWMARRRQSDGVAVIRPGETAALRGWTRDKGILALMIDQAPGEPEEWLSLPGASVKIPWPGRLIDWATSHDPEILCVSTRLDKGVVMFRYDPIPAAALKETIARIMDEALRRAPEQYNWSYPKVRVEGTGQKEGGRRSMRQ